MKLTHSFSVEKNLRTRIGRINTFHQSCDALVVASHVEIGVIKLEHREAPVVLGLKYHAHALVITRTFSLAN